MRLLRRSVNGELSQGRECRRAGELSQGSERRHAARGAWYPDPFGVSDERWWDGRQWTGEARSSAEAETAGPTADQPTRQTSVHTPRRTEKTSGPGSHELRVSDFPVEIEAVVGEQLSIVRSLRKPGMHCQVLAANGRVGSISFFGHETARLVCARGAWFLKRSREDARGFRIESANHTQTGGYLRRQWLPGGTIRLSDGTGAELRRSLPGRWTVRSADGSKCLADVRRSVLRSAQQPTLRLTIHSLPEDATDASMLILAACAVLMLPAAA